MQTPYEQGNRNQTSSWEACIQFYEDLARRFPRWLQFSQIGTSDAGVPIHAGVVSADGIFDRTQIQRDGRPVFFNNNGIHPGEPEGIDACMALVRDLCMEPARLAALGSAVYLFIPIYNVDGCLNRNTSSRVNQDGPESFGFRGNSLHLDLNRDFIKCDSLNAQVFNQFFTAWDPDVMVDTHTSNGADYAYTMTLIHTQADKLGAGLGSFLRDNMVPAIYRGMEARGWPTCPYVNPVKTSPDQGIADFLEVPRFSTGYAALHHTIGFMPETHMLKPFADRYAAMRALLDVTLQYTVENAAQIQALRQEAKRQGREKKHWPISWRMDESRCSSLRFKGYEAAYRPSLIGNYQRLFYDRSQAWEREIAYYTHFEAEVVVPAPLAYVVPQAWRAVIERLAWNGVQMERLGAARSAAARIYRIQAVQSRPGAYEGHMFHEQLTLDARTETVELQAGDCWIPLKQDQARYVMETLEPQAHDSFFRWGFFNSILEKKESFSDYVFEDMALQLLQDEPALNARFMQWKAENPERLSDQRQVLRFIFENCARFAEPAWRRYPVLAIF
ncbi:M14 family zinc carboxypeptidase [Polaromonas jejuensis]|uniref:M14 family zinc carboxypeptidase n=1 Tax=Polaromonas jejuensis TaxID=457502 RepID=A0ABW0QF58_9BURK|nr:M14 family zinc carboxypeptidase [Polaromonas jejuensis]